MSKGIKPKQSEQAMSGSLITFGNIFKLGEFTEKKVMFAKGVGNLARSMYYYVPRGKDAGAGRLSAGMATDAASYVKASILGDGRDWRYKGPPLSNDYDKYYRVWKDKFAWKGKFVGGHPAMLLTGNLANAVTATRKLGGLGWSVNIKNTKVDSPIVGTGVDGKPTKTQKVSPAMYGYNHELGIGTLARPIISGSMLGWISERSSRWATLFERYMKVLLEANPDDDAISDDVRFSPAPNSSASDPHYEGSTSMGDANRSFVENVADIEHYADLFEETYSFLKKIARMSRTSEEKVAPGSKQERKLTNLVRDNLPNASAEVIKDVVEALRTGKVPNISEDMV